MKDEVKNLQPEKPGPSSRKVLVPKPRKPRVGVRILRIFLIAINPGGLLQASLKRYPWYWGLSVSGLAFMLFFLQMGLDLVRAGNTRKGELLSVAFSGLLCGTLGVALFAVATWLAVRAWRNGHGVGWSVKVFGLGYAPALVYTGCGVAANLLLGWNTSVSFGLPGLVWACMPMMRSIQKMTGGKRLASLLFTLSFVSLVIGILPLLIPMV